MKKQFGLPALKYKRRTDKKGLFASTAALPRADA
jgi:hypothetical protein